MNLEPASVHHPRNHPANCAFHVDQYVWECTCGYAAQGIEAATAGETVGLDGNRESPVGNADAPHTPEQTHD